MNYSYFGGGNYCVGDACKYYFNKTPSEMDLYDSTLLAWIPNAPSKYSPSVNKELSKQRQKQVIKKMVNCKYLTEDEAKELYTRIGSIKRHIDMYAIINKKEWLVLGE